MRHSVGEYSEEEWRRHSEQSKRGIEQLRARLRAIGSEITRLTEIQALISGTRATAAPAPPPPPTGPGPAPRAEVVEQALLVTHVAADRAGARPSPRRRAPTDRGQPEPGRGPGR